MVCMIGLDMVEFICPYRNVRHMNISHFFLKSLISSFLNPFLNPLLPLQTNPKTISILVYNHYCKSDMTMVCHLSTYQVCPEFKEEEDIMHAYHQADPNDGHNMWGFNQVKLGLVVSQVYVS